MARLTMPAAGMSVAALILLTACGGGGGDNGSDKIQTTQTSTPSRTPSATASASASSGVQRPKITFPSYAKNVFEDQHTGDLKKDTVLADNAGWINSTDDAIFRGQGNSPALYFYSGGTALRSESDYVKSWVSSGDTWVGITRYFDRKVTFLGDGSAAVIYCSDESKAYTKSGKTGKVDRSPATRNAYVLYNTRLVESKQGVWQTVDVTSKPGAEQCQP